MKRFTLSLVALLLCLCIQAQHRSEQEAIQIAQEFFAKKQMKKAPRLSVVPQQNVSQQIQRRVASAKKAPNKNSSCYIINDEENNRFVIVAADKRLSTILGYSDNTTFDASFTPDGLLDMLGWYDVQYQILLTNFEHWPYSAKKRKIEGKIKPFIQTQWGQGYPFNRFCPMNDDGTQNVAGCGAVAMAQIMNYYNYPTTGKGSNSYFTKSQFFYEKVNFDTLNIEWNKMVNVYDDNCTEEQEKEVAKLAYACGVAISTDYGEKDSLGNLTGQSVAYAQNIPYAMVNFFNYNSNTVYKNRMFYTDDEWYNIIDKELEAGHPILYAGSGCGSHEFILDGRDSNGLYHFNFGWKGTDDGFYELDALREPMDEIKELLYEMFGLTPWDFSENHNMVCGIVPQKYGNNEDIFYAPSFSPSSLYSTLPATINIGSIDIVPFAVICFDSKSTYDDYIQARFEGEIGIGVFNEQLDFMASLFSKDVTCLFGEIVMSTYSFIIWDKDVFNKDGKYYIGLYAKSTNNDKPTIIRTIEGKSDLYPVEVKGNKMELGMASDYHTVGVSNIIESNSNNLNLIVDDGRLIIIADENCRVRISTIGGSIVKQIQAVGGELYQVELPEGIYVINNKKIIVK